MLRPVSSTCSTSAPEAGGELMRRSRLSVMLVALLLDRTVGRRVRQAHAVHEIVDEG